MYNQLREKTGKRYIKKYQNTPGPLEMEIFDPVAPVSATDILASLPTSTEFQQQNQETLNYNNWNSTLSNLNQTKVELATLNRKDFETRGEYVDERQRLRGLAKQQKQMLKDYGDTKGGILAEEEHKLDMADRRAQEAAARDAELREGFGGNADGTLASAVGNFADGNWKTGVADLAVAGVKAIDNLAMGDKNFGAQSEAIDGAVHGISGALMKSGNPYAMIAGAALEGANFLTKAGGQTVQGFDVDINSSGYGEMGHMASSSSRDFGAMIGLGGLNRGKMQAKLQKRNQQAMMAMNAANIAEEQTFEQEARMNSIQNTVMNNQIALSGGLETSLLGG